MSHFSQAQKTMYAHAVELVGEKRFADLLALQQLLEQEAEARKRAFEREEDELRKAKERTKGGRLTVDAYQRVRDRALERLQEQFARLSAIDLAMGRVYYANGKGPGGKSRNTFKDIMQQIRRVLSDGEHKHPTRMLLEVDKLRGVKNTTTYRYLNRYFENQTGMPLPKTIQEWRMHLDM